MELTGEFTALTARDDDADEVAVPEPNPHPATRLRRVGEFGRDRVVEELVDGDRQCDAGDVVPIGRKERLDHGRIVCA